LRNKIYNDLILFGREWAFVEVGIETFVPSSGNLGGRSVLNLRGNIAPLLSVLLDEVEEDRILVFRPKDCFGGHERLSEKVWRGRERIEFRGVANHGLSLEKGWGEGWGKEGGGRRWGRGGGDGGGRGVGIGEEEGGKWRGGEGL
jgi:hypothetical protein